MTVGVRVKANRTTGSGPPPELLFGEIAYSDTDQQLYIGRPAPAPPAVFKSNLSDQAEAIALLNAATDSQADAIGLLFTTVSTQGDALAALANDTQSALETKANEADLAVVAKSGAYSDLEGKPTLFSGAYSDLSGLPTLFSGAYADLSGKPALFSGAYGDLSGKPTLFSGAYADLSGKPALFSGAYADLSGKPTIPYGFTYDQVLEPSSPATGATWRERTSGGAIVGDWEWSATHAVWLALRSYDISGPSTVGSTAISFTSAEYEEKRRLINYVNVHVTKASGTFDASNYTTITPLLEKADGTIILNNSAFAVVTTTAGYVVTKKSTVNGIYTPAKSRISRSSVGAPGTTIAWISFNVRDVRP